MIFRSAGKLISSPSIYFYSRTSSTKSGIFIVSIRAVWCSIAKILNGYAMAVARTPERLVWMACICE